MACKLNQSQMLNPIFPSKGLYSHSTFETAPNGKQIENYHYFPHLKEVGSKCMTQIICVLSEVEKQSEFLYPLGQGKYKTLIGKIVEAKKNNRYGNDYTHIVTMEFEWTGYC
jgi:hypothetical protein